MLDIKQIDYFICKYCNNKSKNNSNYCIDIGTTIENNKDVFYCLDCLDSYEQEYLI